MKQRQLKNITFGYNLFTREFEITPQYGQGITLNRSQAGAFQRFVFSMFQFHPNKKKA